MLKGALAHAPKLLLTATPLQNSLLELFGLVSFVDEHTFGDLASFREQFSDLDRGQVFETLKARLKPVCHRTLRRQVLSYVRFTQRLPILQSFTPEEGEDRLYHFVSEYLQRSNLYALPASQRSLITLVLRKLLASSTFAIAGALESMSKRLQAKLKKHEPAETLEDDDPYPNLTLKKIPNAVLKRCEWGKDDYSLQVENLPKAPEAPHPDPLPSGEGKKGEPGQMELI